MDLIQDRDFVFCILDYDVIMSDNIQKQKYDHCLLELKEFCKEYNKRQVERIQFYEFPEDLNDVKNIFRDISSHKRISIAF